MITAQEFINERNGKAVDVDGAYGAQCWDLFAYFCKCAGYPILNCTSTGYAKDIWNLRKSSGALNYFVEAPIMQKGDWCIWGETSNTPYSHIAMFVSDAGNGYGNFLGQNQNGSSVANIVKLPYTGTLGALRPKCYISNDFVGVAEYININEQKRYMNVYTVDTLEQLSYRGLYDIVFTVKTTGARNICSKIVNGKASGSTDMAAKGQQFLIRMMKL